MNNIKENIDVAKKKVTDFVKDYKKNFNVPNALTTTRIIMSLPLALSFILGIPEASFWLFSTGMITDFFDGIIARKYNLETSIGKRLDQVADKIFGIAGLVGAAFIYPTMGLNILGELIIAGTCYTLYKKKLSDKSTQIGRVKTALLGTQIGFALLTPILSLSPTNIINLLPSIISFPMFGLQMLTVGSYVKRGKLEKQKRKLAQINFANNSQKVEIDTKEKQRCLEDVKNNEKSRIALNHRDNNEITTYSKQLIKK